MRQYKDLETTIKDVDEKGRVLVAANAIGNTDSDKDISETGSFDKTLKENFNRLKWYQNHNTNLLLGVPISGEEKNFQLQMLGQLNMKKELSRDIYEDYKLYAEYGRSLEHSIGVEAVKKEQKDDTRRVFEWKLWEYSTLTSWGANSETPLIGIKSLKDINESIEWLSLKLRKGNFTDDRFMQIENQLNILRSLCTEPEASTQMAKPSEEEVTKFLKQYREQNLRA